MNKQEEFVYSNVYTGCINGGVPKDIAIEMADMALKKYKTNRFGKASDLILDCIKQGKKINNKGK